MAAAYFAYLAGIAIVHLHVRAAATAVATLLCIVIIGMLHVMPLVYLLIGYWLPALLVRRSRPRFEQRLLAFDHALFGTGGLRRFEQRAPRLLIEYLELSYLLCYAVVPVGWAVLLLAGHGPAAIDRFWFIVLLASFICYGMLPWVPTRAPRAIEAAGAPARSLIRGVNLAVLNRASVQWNTFPSGHTAASLATALAVGTYMPGAGIAIGVVACSIAVGSVVGRYHYAADAITGAVAAVFAFVMAGVVRAL